MENLNEVVKEELPEGSKKINGNGKGEKPVINEDEKEKKEKINS